MTVSRGHKGRIPLKPGVIFAEETGARLYSIKGTVGDTRALAVFTDEEFAPLLNVINGAFFDCLQEAGIPVTYAGRNTQNSAVFRRSLQAPFVAIAWGRMCGSYLVRHPITEENRPLPEPQVEVFLNTASRLWKGRKYDLPLVLPVNGSSSFHLYDATKPVLGDQPLAVIDGEENIAPEWRQFFTSVVDLARRSFLALRRSWPSGAGELAHLGTSFGIIDGQVAVGGIFHPGSYGTVKEGVFECLELLDDDSKEAQKVKCVRALEAAQSLRAL